MRSHAGAWERGVVGSMGTRSGGEHGNEEWWGAWERGVVRVWERGVVSASITDLAITFNGQSDHNLLNSQSTHGHTNTLDFLPNILSY